MRLLLLTTKYPVGPSDSYMTSELGDELVCRGHQVDVVSLDWNVAPGTPSTLVTTKGGVRVLTIAPSGLNRGGVMMKRIAKWFGSSRHAVAQAKATFDVKDYDAILAFTPCVAISALLGWARGNRTARRVLFIYDFFPIHHRELGLVPPGPIYQVLKAWENRLFRSFDLIFCNLPSNIDYLRARYRLKATQKVTSTPLWTVGEIPSLKPRDEVRRAIGLPLDRQVAIFGGQLTEGRGVEMMLAVAEGGRTGGDPIDFLFVGGGRLESLVKAQANLESSNVHHLAWIDRADYLSVVGACDVGMIATVQGVSSHSFPTKLIDYVKGGIPVVSAVEPDSDFSKIIARYGLGASVPAEDAPRFLEAVRAVLGDDDLRETIRASSQKCLTEHLDVARACERLEGELLAPTA